MRMKIKPIIGTLILLAAICLTFERSIPVYSIPAASATYLSMNVTSTPTIWTFQGRLRNGSSPFIGIPGKAVTLSTGTGVPGDLPYVILVMPTTNATGGFYASASLVPWKWLRAVFVGDATWQGSEYYVFPGTATTTVTTTTTNTTTLRFTSTSTTGTTSIQTTITIFLTSTSSTTMTIGATTAAFTITSPTTIVSTYTVFSVSTSTSTYWTDTTNTITSLRTYTSMTATPLTVTATQVTTSLTTTTTVATSTTTVPFNVQDPTTTYAFVICAIMVIAFAAIFTFRQKTGNV